MSSENYHQSIARTTLR